MAPWQGGGNMNSDVTFEKNDAPERGGPLRKRGTGSIGDAVGLGAALD
jgi:cysteine desulfurase/selenocysteine lyase